MLIYTEKFEPFKIAFGYFKSRHFPLLLLHNQSKQNKNTWLKSNSNWKQQVLVQLWPFIRQCEMKWACGHNRMAITSIPHLRVLHCTFALQLSHVCIRIVAFMGLGLGRNFAPILLHLMEIAFRQYSLWTCEPY